MNDGDGEAPTILIVEDDESLRQVLARQLGHAGFRVVGAGSVEEAAAALGDGLRPAAVVLDVNLPGDTGWDLLRTSALDGAGHPPVVVATGLPINPRRLAEFGVAGYLPKPFPVETLVDTLRRVLAGVPTVAKA